MKANEAPEKIYLSDFTDTTESVFYVKQDNTKKTDFEYIRTDAFIEKARKWFEERSTWIDIEGSRQCDMESFDDFRKYMKGE